MTPRQRRGRGGGRQLNEAARLTQVLVDAGFTKADVGRIIGRNPSLVSQFFTRGKGAAFVEALTAAVREYQVGAATTVEALRSVAAPHVARRQARSGPARVRTRDVAETPGHSAMARAGRQHIASGASRLRPVVQHTADVGGRIAFTVRARRSAFLIGSGWDADSPGVRRNVVQRPDGTEERAYGNSAGPGMGEAGFDAAEWQQRVDAAGGDVAAAIRTWMVETGRLADGARITNLEVRGWLP